MELIKNQIQFCDRVLDRTSVYEETTDAIVPDSFPDIARIVCATGSAVIKDESPQGDRVLVSGTVHATVLYQPEGEEGLRVMSVPINFAHIEEGKGLTADSTCFVCCRVVNVDARTANSRKLNVTAKLCFETSAYDGKQIALTEDVDGGELPLEIQYHKQTVSLPQTVAIRDFTVLEDLETPYAEGTKLLHTRCDLCLTDSRTMHSKAVVKGDARLHCLLLENGGMRITEHTVPFTQILDCDGLEEGQSVSVRFAIRNLDSELHEGGVLSVGIGACALLCVMQEQEIRSIGDLYQTTCPLEVQSRPVHITGLDARGELRGEVADTVPVGIRVGRVIDVSAVCHAVSQEDASTLRLTAAVNLLVQDEDAQPYSVTRTMTLPVPLPQAMEGGTAQNLVLNASATPAGDDSVSLRVQVAGDLYSRAECVINDITQVEAGAPATDPQDAVTLVLRYVDDDETLWDIAKRYHTTVRAIRGANDMAADTENVRARMLLIPICEK